MLHPLMLMVSVAWRLTPPDILDLTPAPVTAISFPSPFPYAS